MGTYRRNLLLHKALGNMTYSSDPKPYMSNKNKPLWDDFNSLIEQAVVIRKPLFIVNRCLI